jgi:hypothetical protein
VDWSEFKFITTNFNRHFFLRDWGFNSGLCACKAGLYLPLEPYLQSIFALVILEMGYFELFAWVGLKSQSSQVARITGVSH